MGSPLGVLMGGFALDMIEAQISSYEVQPELHQHNVDGWFDIVENENQAPILIIGAQDRNWGVAELLRR